MSSSNKLNSDFDTQLHQKRELVNNTINQLLANLPMDHEMKEVLSYTLQSPGKCIRSVLALWCCELVGGQINRNAEIAAAAIEIVHTYSLVHDDLPAMDNDDLRRGRLTCHKAFDEATAILAGDALLTLGFEILANEIDEPAMSFVRYVNLKGIMVISPKTFSCHLGIFDCSCSGS